MNQQEDKIKNSAQISNKNSYSLVHSVCMKSFWHILSQTCIAFQGYLAVCRAELEAACVIHAELSGVLGLGKKKI